MKKFEHMINLFSEEVSSHRLCVLFLTKLVHDSTGSKSRKFIRKCIDEELKWETNLEKIRPKYISVEALRNESYKSWLERVEDFERNNSTCIPKIGWERI